MRKKRNTPSYKTLYKELQQSIAQDGYIEYTTSTPTHTFVVYDTVEWIYHIKADNEEQAENFSPGCDGVELIAMEKRIYRDRIEIHPAKFNVKKYS